MTDQERQVLQEQDEPPEDKIYRLPCSYCKGEIYESEVECGDCYNMPDGDIVHKDCMQGYAVKAMFALKTDESDLERG